MRDKPKNYLSKIYPQLSHVLKTSLLMSCYRPKSSTGIMHVCNYAKVKPRNFYFWISVNFAPWNRFGLLLRCVDIISEWIFGRGLILHAFWSWNCECSAHTVSEKCQKKNSFRKVPGTGKYLSEALVLGSSNPQYDKILFIDLPV